ncbi:MAG: hypothetical protein NTX50_05285 [Candidatus Sumerlaeota bacterium]|nr:hypothetical protein [Candidatus Sumerlaeota bacterium]
MKLMRLTALHLTCLMVAMAAAAGCLPSRLFHREKPSIFPPDLQIPDVSYEKPGREGSNLAEPIFPETELRPEEHLTILYPGDPDYVALGVVGKRQPLILNHGLGRRYAPQRGLASYYQQILKTAAGKPYKSLEMTAAHRTLPFGTVVRCSPAGSHLSVIVTINNRGPLIKGRIIDLNYAAAVRINLIEDGLLPCEVEILAYPVGSADDREPPYLLEEKDPRFAGAKPSPAKSPSKPPAKPSTQPPASSEKNNGKKNAAKPPVAPSRKSEPPLLAPQTIKPLKE